MVYDKQTWVNGVAGGTPINASRLQHIEDGLLAISLMADAAETPAETAAAIAAQHTADNATYVAATVLTGVGIDPTGATDSTATLQAKINAAVAAGGGAVYLPPGTYLHTGLTLGAGIHLTGPDPMTGGSGAATLVYTGTGARGIDARFNGCRISGVRCLYNSAAFTGTLIDFTGALKFGLARVVLAGAATADNGAASLVEVVNANYGAFDDINFFGRTVDCVRGQSAGGQFSNVMTFRNCNFGQSRTGATTPSADSYSGHAIKNPGTAWTFINCNFEPNSAGVPAAVGYDAFAVGLSVTFVGGWTGDIPTNYAGTQAWIDTSPIGGNFTGLRIVGTMFSIPANAPAVKFTGQGLDISADFVVEAGAGTGTVAINLGNCSGVNIRPSCTYTGFGANNPIVITGTVASGVIPGHMSTQGIAPAVAVGPGLGTAPPAITVTGDDSGGVVSFGTGTAVPAGQRLFAVTFAQPYTNPPAVCLTGIDFAVQAAGLVLHNVTAAGFEVWSVNALGGAVGSGGYLVHYIVKGLAA